jgi:hypothetical protein
MKHSLIIIIFTILFTGCTINMAPSQEQVEKKVPAQTEMRPTDEERRHKPWPQEAKEYWIARYFFTMASSLQIQQMLQPHEVFEIVKCAMAKYEKDHDYAWFLANLGETKMLTPVNNKYVYDTTTVCANITKAKNLKLQGAGGTI